MFISDLPFGVQWIIKFSILVYQQQTGWLRKMGVYKLYFITWFKPGDTMIAYNIYHFCAVNKKSNLKFILLLYI